MYRWEQHGERYPGLVELTELPNGDVEVRVKSKDSVSSGFVRLPTGVFEDMVAVLGEEIRRRNKRSWP